MDQVHFAFNVLWCQYISWWVWFENNKHRFHKPMSPVINSNFPTLLNSDSCYLALPWSLHLSALAPEAGRRQTGKSNRAIDEEWEELEKTALAYKVHSSSCIFACTLSLSHMTPAVEEGLKLATLLVSCVSSPTLNVERRGFYIWHSPLMCH